MRLVMGGQEFPRFFAFAVAHDFHRTGESSPLARKLNRIESVGHLLQWGVGSLADTLFREIKNPIMIVALTALALLVVTICFYPAQALAVVGTICPPLLKLTPAMLKGLFYIITQSTVLGFGIRTYGRLVDQELVAGWRAGTLLPILPGSRKIS